MKRMAEPFLAFAALVLTATLLMSRNADMSDMTQMTMLGFFTLAVLAYGAFLFRENPADEREHELSMVASKYAYLLGSAVLTVGIIVQTLDHKLDPWLPIALTVMVAVKSVTYFIKK